MEVPAIVVPGAIHPHPLLSYQTNEPAGFCVHPGMYYVLGGDSDDDDEDTIAVLPAPCLETRKEIARREIAVLEETVNAFEGMPVEPAPFSLATSCFTREGCRLMAKGYREQIHQLGLNAHQVDILRRAEAMGSTPEQRETLRRWQDPRRYER